MASIIEPDHPEYYSFAAPRQQLFAFPPDVFSRMLENPSSHAGLMKLYQTCKYFYAKRPILIADDVMIGKNGHRDYDYDDDQMPSVKMKLSHGYKNITLLQIPLWLTNTLKVGCCQRQRLPKFFRSSIKKLFVSEGKLSYDDFVYLVSEKNVVSFKLVNALCLHHSGRVLIEEVLQHLPNIRKFGYYTNERYSRESLIKLNKLKFNTKFEFVDLILCDVHPTFDFDLFCEFITKNCDTNTKFYLNPWSKNLKTALAKMDPKWKTEALDGLKKLFHQIESNDD